MADIDYVRKCRECLYEEFVVGGIAMGMIQSVLVGYLGDLNPALTILNLAWPSW